MFAVKVSAYFKARGVKRLANMLKPFDSELQPLIKEIDAKKEAIREFAGAATMKRIENIGHALLDMALELKQLNATQEIHNSIKDELLTILTPLEPLKRHQDVKMSRTENTSTWLLNLDPFCEWRDKDTVEEGGYVFCCYGIPGAGKTVTCSVAIDNLYSQLHNSSNIGIACLYADYKDQSNQTLAHILGSFLHQFLTTQRAHIPEEIIQKLQDIRRRASKPGIEDSLALLRTWLHQLNRVFICIDAVDELEPKILHQLLSVLQGLVTNSKFGSNKIRIFLTGRSHIEAEVQKYLPVGQNHKVTIRASQDIQEFVEQQITSDTNQDDVLAKDIVNLRSHKECFFFLSCISKWS